MQKALMIQAITVGENLQKRFAIGDEIDGREVNEIKCNTVEWENGIDFVYILIDEEGYKIVEIENMPVLAEFKLITVDGPVEQTSLTNK